MSPTPPVLLLASLAACSTPRDEFDDRYIEALCATTIRCQTVDDDDEDVYDDQSECESSLRDSEDVSEHANCDYDASKASECLDAVYDLGCQPSDDRYEALWACDQVWSCPEDGDDTGEDDR